MHYCIAIDTPEPPTLDHNSIVPMTTSVRLSWDQSVPSDFRRVEQYIVELSTNGGPFVEVSTNTTAHHILIYYSFCSGRRE